METKECKDPDIIGCVLRTADKKEQFSMLSLNYCPIGMFCRGYVPQNWPLSKTSYYSFLSFLSISPIHLQLYEFLFSHGVLCAI